MKGFDYLTRGNFGLSEVQTSGVCGLPRGFALQGPYSCAPSVALAPTLLVDRFAMISADVKCRAAFAGRPSSLSGDRLRSLGQHAPRFAEL
jgi:hypothetical protein